MLDLIKMFKRITDIIDIIQSYHDGLSDYFLSLKTKVEEERAIMLLDYLSKSERFHNEYLEKYKKITSKKILNMWVKYVPWLPTDIYCECKEELEISLPLHVYDVLTIALHFDNCLINFYTILVQEMQNPGAEELFSNLLRVTKKHDMNLSRDVAWLNDI